VAPVARAQPVYLLLTQFLMDLFSYKGQPHMELQTVLILKFNSKLISPKSVTEDDGVG
jgi:hypothetical protein